MQWLRTAAGVSADSCYAARGGDYVIYRVGRAWMVYDGQGHLLQALLPSLTAAKAWCEDHQRTQHPSAEDMQQIVNRLSADE